MTSFHVRLGHDRVLVADIELEMRRPVAVGAQE